jgi:hypothetical protein
MFYPTPNSIAALIPIEMLNQVKELPPIDDESKQTVTSLYT